MMLGVEVALSLVLLTAAALLLNSFRHLLRVAPGFAGDGVLVVDVRPPRAAATHAQEVQFYDALAGRAVSAPGVQRAALVHSAPGMHGGAWSRAVPDDMRAEAVSDRTRAPVQSLLDPGEDFYRLNPVRGDVFATLGIPILAGRSFDAEPGPGDPLSVVLNQTAARRLFPDVERPIGRLIAIGEPGTPAPLREVVGIVGDVRQRGSARAPDAQIYLPYGQRDIGRMTLLIKLAPGAAVDAAVIRQLVHDVAPDVPVDGIESVADRYSEMSGEHRFLAFLLAVFAGLGLTMAVVGTYATAMQTVARRIQEFGIRAALGATSANLFHLVVSGTVTVAGIAMACGLLASVILSRFLESYVFGISARDPVTFAAVAVIIGISATTAAAVPALRAARIDPNSVMRTE
jgi:putative ABC transport system permease protein